MMADEPMIFSFDEGEFPTPPGSEAGAAPAVSSALFSLVFHAYHAFKTLPKAV